MPFYIDSSSGTSKIRCLNKDTGQADPMNLLIVGSVGSGKSLCGSEMTKFYHDHGYTVISLSDVKDNYEFGFTAFQPTAPYHIRQLDMFACPKYAVPIKIYHPYTFNIPIDIKLPPINFYTINIKTLNRTDLKFLAESNENKRSIQIVLDTANKLDRDEGLHHLVYKAEAQTESINITKSNIKYRSDDPDDFFTKTKIGTDRSASEIIAYFQPFNTDYNLAPENCPYNINIKEIMNDQQNYHIFSTKWIKDERLKSLYIIHLLREIIQNEAYAKHPILIYLEEIRFLIPNTSEGYVPFLAEEIKSEMTRFRNMGKGYAIIGTSQVYGDVHPDVISSFNDWILGRIISFKELEMIQKSLKLNTADTNTIKNLSIGEFVINAQEEYAEEKSIQKIRMFMPPHAHKEQKQSFFEKWEQEYPETMQTINEQHKYMTELKKTIIQDVTQLKDKENAKKKQTETEVKEQKQQQKKVRVNDIELQKKKQKTQQLNEQQRTAIINAWNEAIGKEKSTRKVATKLGIFLSDGVTPNHTLIQKVLREEMEKTIEQDSTSSTSEDS